MLEKEQSISTEKIFDGKIIKVRVDKVKCQNDHVSTREVVEHPGGVCIVAITNDKKVLLVNQYRRPFDEITLELPAGKLEWGEEPYDCAVRELKEETGYSAEKFTYLGYYYSTPGFCNEKIYIYMAEGLTAGETCPDENEFLEILEYSFDELLDMIYRNELVDGKTAIGVMKAYLLLNK